MLKLIILLSAAVASSGLAGNFYLALSRRCRGKAAHSLMPVFWLLPLSAVFFVAALLNGGIEFKASILLPALLSGISCAVAAVMFLNSFERNSFSTAVIIINLNFVIPVIFSTIFLNEKVLPLQIIGVVLAAAVIIIINYKPDSGKFAILLPVAASFANGMMNFGIKIQQYLTPGKGEQSFFAFTYLIAALCCLIVFAFTQKEEKSEMDGRAYIRCLPPALGIGLCNGVCFYTVSLITGYLNAAAQFTIITILSVMISLIIGFTVQHDKFTARTLISVICCAAAIVCQCVGLAI